MSFEEAKTVVEKEYKEQTQRTALNKLAEATLKNFDEANTTTSDFLTQSSKVSFEGLTEKESLHFLEKLFTSSQENGIISLLDKVIVYSVIEQKFDKNEEMFDTQMVKQVKQGSFETTLLELLSEKFKTETY
jgi:peptidyl-prolyl cis-trans isomerase D